MADVEHPAETPEPNGGVVFIKPEAPAPVQAGDGPLWPGWLGPLAVFLGFASVIAIGLVLAVAVGIGGGGDTTQLEEQEHWLALLQGVIWVAVACVLPFLVLGSLRPGQLGLRGAPIGRAILIGVVVMIAFYVLSALYVSAAGLGEGDNELLQDLGFGDSLSKDIALLVAFTIAAPVAEELLFRGVLYRSLRDGFVRRFGGKAGVVLGIVLSGVFFGAIHAGNGQDDYLPALMMLGMLLAIAYQWSGTLYVPIAMHAWNNVLATATKADGNSLILNPDVSADWLPIAAFAAPVLAVLAAMLIGRIVKVAFSSTPPGPAPTRPVDV